jgi:Tol biopolymer transport system component
MSGTQPGVVLGTMGYMSPEQVRGRPADRRSDLFAFGAILHEMLSGQKAFRGDTAADTITAILTKEPPELSQTNKEIHPGVDRIVRHCLEKNPEERFESARDVAFDLEALSSVSSPATAVPSAASDTPRRRGRLPIAAALALALLGAAAGVLLDRRLTKIEPPSFQQLTFRRGDIKSARFAPDGQTILYSAGWDGRPLEIFSRRLESPESRSTGLAGTELLAVSRSGEMAVSLDRRPLSSFHRTGRLASTSIAGGVAPREILDDVQWADFAPDGKEMAIVREVGGRNRVEFPVGKPVFETTGFITHPRISPKGDAVAFCHHPTQGDDGGEVVLAERAGKSRKLPGDYATIQGLAWSPSGSEIWFTAAIEGANRALYSVTPSGRVRLLSRVTGSMTLHDVARDGRVLVTHDAGRQGIMGLGPGDTQERLLGWLDFPSARDLSADGSLLLFDETGEGGGPGYSVYIRKTDGSPATRLGDGAAAALSPDGKWALAAVAVSGNPQMVLYPTGVGEPLRLPVEGLRVQMEDWLPDGKGLVIAASEPGHGTRLYQMDLAGGKPRAFSPEGYRIIRHGVSPDGKLVVTTGPDQRYYLYPVAGGEPQPIAGVVPQDRIECWTADGRSLIVHRRGELPSKVYKLDVATGRKDLWKELMPLETAGLGDIGGFVLARNGKSYVYGSGWILSDLYLVTGLK